MIHKLLHILLEFLLMSWNIYWGLAFGFMLSSVIRAFVPTESISSKLGMDSLKSIALSSFFGAISSSCSYAAASMARTLLLKGATWPNAVAFMVASTNLVFEIFIVIVSLLGWHFFAGEAIGGIIFIIISALLITKIFPAQGKINAGAKTEPGDHMATEEQNHQHSSEKLSDSTLRSKLRTASGYFYMDVAMVGKDILIGVVVASVLMVLVPDSFWKSIFLTGNQDISPVLVSAWNTLAGILIAILAFVCSVGNIAMGAVLWRGGISFGGVIAFILADLVTVPMLMVYRRYYGSGRMWFLLLVLSLSIFITALLVDFSFDALHWLPKVPVANGSEHGQQFKWDWQCWLNVFFIPASLMYFFSGKRSMGHQNTGNR